MNKTYECLVIGAGPSGIGAAIKLHQAGVDVAVIEMSTPGGKINIAPRVDNYPRQHEIPGPDLAVIFFERLMEEGVEFIGDEITSLDKKGDIFELVGQIETYYAKTVYIATGTVERKIGLPLEDELFGHGLSYCALCDGHFFKGQDVLVIGGGNTALKEAIYLAPIVNKLYLIHRRTEFRGNTKLVAELSEFKNVEILTPYVPVEILGDDKVTGAVIQNVATKENKTLQLQGIFPLVGQLPNNQFIKIDNVTNEWGTIPVDKKMMTGVSGLFAGGDILPRDIRQIYLSEHDGMVASKAIQEYLKGNK